MVKNRIFSLILACLLLCSLCLQVFAVEYPDLSRMCSVELRLVYEDMPIIDGTLRLTRVGYIQEKDGRYCYRRVMDDQLILNILDISYCRAMTHNQYSIGGHIYVKLTCIRSNFMRLLQ